MKKLNSFLLLPFTCLRVVYYFLPKRNIGRYWSRKSRNWLGFRMETAYGSPRLRVVKKDLQDYIKWCAEEFYH